MSAPAIELARHTIEVAIADARELAKRTTVEDYLDPTRVRTLLVLADTARIALDEPAVDDLDDHAPGYVLDFLRRHDGIVCTAADVAHRLNLPAPVARFVLRELEATGRVRRHPEGWAYVRTPGEVMADSLRTFLDDVMTPPRPKPGAFVPNGLIGPPLPSIPLDRLATGGIVNKADPWRFTTGETIRPAVEAVDDLDAALDAQEAHPAGKGGRPLTDDEADRLLAGIAEAELDLVRLTLTADEAFEVLTAVYTRLHRLEDTDANYGERAEAMRLVATILDALEVRAQRLDDEEADR